MVIVINCENINIGKTLGVAHFIFRLLEEIKRKYDVRIICKVSPEMIKLYKKKNIFYKIYSDKETIFQKFFLKSLDNRLIRLSRFAGLFSEKHLAKKIVNYDIELIPHHFQPPIGNRKKVRICHDLHIFDIPWKYSSTQKKIFKKYMVENDAVVTPYIRPYRKIQKLFSEIKDTLFFIPGPTLLGDVTLHKYLLAQNKEKYKPYNTILLYPAQLQRHKNHINLLKAVKIISSKFNKFLLICTGSNFEKSITEEIYLQVKKLNLKNNVTFTGYVSSENLRALYEISNAVISPSYAEGGNMIAQEAIIFNRPVACARTEPSIQQIEYMKARVPLFDPDNPEDIASKITDIIENKDYYVKENAISKTIVESWTWDRMAVQYMDLFKSICQSR